MEFMEQKQLQLDACHFIGFYAVSSDLLICPILFLLILSMLGLLVPVPHPDQCTSRGILIHQCQNITTADPGCSHKSQAQRPCMESPLGMWHVLLPAQQHLAIWASDQGIPEHCIS